MAIGDMDNDKHIDIVTINNYQNRITVHFYNPDTMLFEAAK